MRFYQIIAIAWLALVCAAAPAGAESRVALVIGNGAYAHLPALKNPPNDARDLAAALKALDFDVDLGVDLTLADMQRKVTAFGKRAQTADVALAFFAGHGAQAPDPLGAPHPVNYLLAVDADIKEEADLGFLLTARDVVARLQAAGSVRILILDACRDNPIPQRLARVRGGSVPRGLGPEPKTSGTLIAYSTQPGVTAADGDARNSPFVKALLAHIADPGVDVRLVFTDVRSDVIRASNGAQTPETSDSLNGRFMLRKGAQGAADSPPATPPAPAGVPQVAVVAPPVTPAVPADPCGGPVTASFPSRCAAPLTAAQERGLKPKDSFRECENCPEMVVVPAGAFTMGSPKGEEGRFDDEGAQRVVTIRKPFAVGKLHVTVDQFAAFVRETGYEKSRSCSWRNPGFAQEGLHPVVCVSWDDAEAYLDWMAKKTGKPYRLLSEAEWEYAARGRTSPGAHPRFWFGDDDKDLCRYGNFGDQKAGKGGAPCNDGYDHTSPAGHYQPNAFGLYDMFGNAWQWTADCWHGDYNGAPADGSAWTAQCKASGRVVRGGSWSSNPRDLRAAYRIGFTAEYTDGGVRVARTLTP